MYGQPGLLSTVIYESNKREEKLLETLLEDMGAVAKLRLRFSGSRIITENISTSNIFCFLAQQISVKKNYQYSCIL